MYIEIFEVPAEDIQEFDNVGTCETASLIFDTDNYEFALYKLVDLLNNDTVDTDTSYLRIKIEK